MKRGGAPDSPPWLTGPSVPDSDEDSYGFTCGCPRCLPPPELAALAEPVTTGDRWVRPIDPV